MTIPCAFPKISQQLGTIVYDYLKLYFIVIFVVNICRLSYILSGVRILVVTARGYAWLEQEFFLCILVHVCDTIYECCYCAFCTS